MTLGDDVIDEYSRHILVPEIGPAGQARLLATRVLLVGDGSGTPLLHELLERSGFRVVDAHGDVAMFLAVRPDPDAPRPSVVCWGERDVLHATTLGSHPCPACVTLPPTLLPGSPLAMQALAVLATQALAVRIVAPTIPSSDLRLDLTSGRLETESLMGGGCARCAVEPGGS